MAIAGARAQVCPTAPTLDTSLLLDWWTDDFILKSTIKRDLLGFAMIHFLREQFDDAVYINLETRNILLSAQT